jgi:release factor glutamine methyltransferase
MKSIGEVLALGAQFLKEKGIEQPRKSVEEMLACCLQCSRLDLYMRFEQPLEEKELEALRNMTKRRAKGEPLQYILGEVEFFDVLLSLSSSVLIPRPETEVLASLIAEKLDAEKGPLILWDVCCGSGAIGLAMKKKFPHFSVSLSDLSKGALEIARCNAEKNGVDVAFFEGDLFSPFMGKQADLIVCNPPYISEGDYLLIDPSVRDFEPKSALVGGEDGLVFYRRIAQEAFDFLRPGGRLCLEIGHDQGEAVLKIFSQTSWKNPLLKKDWSGKDRFFFIER